MFLLVFVNWSVEGCNVQFIFGYCMDIEVCIIRLELKYALSINCVDIKFIIFHDGSI